MRRTKTEARGGVSDSELSAMKKISEKWIKIAFRTGRTDKKALTEAICRLYAAAGLKRPRVVVVPSPFVMAIAYGISSIVWARRKNSKNGNATRIATGNAVVNATDKATRIATYDATYDATVKATAIATTNATDNATVNATEEAAYNAADNAAYNATYDATANATVNATEEAADNAADNAAYNATYNATVNATDNAAYNATYIATYNATVNATDDGQRDIHSIIGHFAKCEKEKRDMAEAARNWRSVYQGGNMWAGFPAYAEAMRDVIGLTGLSCWEKYQAWEDCAKLGGFRVMHEEFCLVSDFPDILQVDSQNRPHCTTGPSHRWSDGFEIYHLNGVRVPKELVMTDAGQLDATKWLKHENADVRAEFIRKYGIERLKSRGKVIDTWRNYDDAWFEKSEYELVDMSPVFTRLEYAPYLSMRNQSVPGVWHMEAVPRAVRTVQEAVEFRTKTKNPKIINIK